MRYQDISGKEIIDMSSGDRLGVLGQTDLEINPDTGKIESFIIPNYKWFGLKKDDPRMAITWDMIQKIGTDIVLIDMDKHPEN